jgi:hypothetical protein
MHTFIGNKEHELKVYQTKNQIGLNIDSFVSTFSFNNIVMNQRAMLFINYMEFFHKSHTKYLKRFATKVNLMLSQINNDIKMDTVQNTQAAAKDTVNELKSQNLDKKLLNELKLSMNDDASIETKTPTSRSKSGSDSGVSDSGRSDDLVIEITNDIVSELTGYPEVKPKPRFLLPCVIPENSFTGSLDSSVAEPSAEAPVEPLTEAPVEPLTEALVEPLTEATVEPLTEAPVEPLTEATSETAAEASDSGLLEPPEESLEESPNETIENIFT